MRDHSKHVEVDRNKAIELLLGACTFSPRTETVPITQALGRVLAKDAVAQLDMPNCLTCNMDSVAVHWEDFAEGMPDTTGWQRGVQWEFANTGVGMPEGFDTAIVIEHVTFSADEQEISFDAAPSAQFAGTSPAGSRMHAGDVLVEAGSTLTPLLLSHIASGNNTQVEVYVKPQVGFIPTGNELVCVGTELERGKNLETNSIVAAGKIEGWGGTCKVYPIVPDNQDAIKEAVLTAARECDIVVLNAGSSKGSDDWNIEMLEEIGTVLYHETNHGPGHHSSGSVVEGTPVVGISGPPGGAAFTMDFYLYPAIMAYFGQPTEAGKLQVRLGRMFPKGGPGHKPPADANKGEGEGSAPGAPGAPGARGEDRPSVVAEGGEFFGVQQLQFYQEEGSAELWAMPASSPRANPVEAETMDAYYLLSNKRDAPLYGEILEVDVRP